MPWLLGLILLSLAPLAQGANERSDFFVDLQYGLATTKSKLLASNDTGSSLRYGFGVLAGQDQDLAFRLNFDQDKTAFELNSSSLSLSWQDTRIQYALGPFYLGPIWSQLAMKAQSAGTDTIDAAGGGIGVGAGLLFALKRGGSLYLDVTSVSIPNMKNALTQTVAVSQRMDIDLGGSLELSRYLDLIVGYRRRTYTVTTDAAYSELTTATYLGLRFGLAL